MIILNLAAQISLQALRSSPHSEGDPRTPLTFKRGSDSNFLRKKEILAELINIIAPTSSVDDLMNEPKIRDSQLMDALEYGRMVHAEMSALSDAARIGHPVIGGTLYCTTFPCHMCAKHIVAAGIKSVVFLEPYPKSLATDLHADSIRVEGGDRGHYQSFPAVDFEHFFGVTPRRYREIFERSSRKNEKDGSFIEYQGGEPHPVVDVKYPFYVQLEEHLTDETIEALKKIVSETELTDV